MGTRDPAYSLTFAQKALESLGHRDRPVRCMCNILDLCSLEGSLDRICHLFLQIVKLKMSPDITKCLLEVLPFENHRYN